MKELEKHMLLYRVPKKIFHTFIKQPKAIVASIIAVGVADDWHAQAKLIERQRYKIAL